MTSERSPWPGPRPFTEDEAALLFARGEELDEVAKALRTKVVVQLTSPSGAGKTSFLSAKLVTAMKKAGWVPLLYRTWGHVGRSGTATDGETLFRQVLRSAVENHNGSKGTPLTVPFAPFGDVGLEQDVSVLQEATAASGGLVLIFDQFEELFRRDRLLHDEFLATVVDVARKYGLRQVVSLRKEYADDVRPFLATLGSMGQSWLRMTEIDDPERLSAVIARPPAHPDFGVQVTDEAVERILEWLASAKQAQADARRGRLSEDSRGIDLGASNIGLIHLQAVLWAFWSWWRPNHRESSEIGLGDVEAFASARGASGADLIRSALWAWIDDAFAKESVMLDEGVKLRDGDVRARLAIERLGTVRDQAAHLADHLSAGGYKITQECTKLAQRCIGADLITLGVKRASFEVAVMAALAQFGFDEQPKEPTLIERLEKAHECAMGLVEFDVELRAKERVAGRPYLKYSAELRASEDEPSRVGDDAARLASTDELDERVRKEAAAELIMAFAAALAQLRDGYIVRETPRQSGVLLVEIVHDGFGPVLSEWAAHRIDSNHWAIDAVTAVKGKDLIWQALDHRLVPDGEARGLCWRGCWISAPTKATEARMIVSGVTFRDCDFSGSGFNRIDFIDATFEDCDFTGCLFLDCRFDGFTLTNGKMAGATFRDVSAVPLEHPHEGRDHDMARAVFDNMFGDNMVLDGARGGRWQFSNLSVEHCRVHAKPELDGEPSFDLLVVDGNLKHWSFGGRPKSVTLRECTVAYSTAEAERGDEGWLHFDTSGDVVLCSFPEPVLDEMDQEIRVRGYGGMAGLDARRWLTEPAPMLPSSAAGPPKDAVDTGASSAERPESQRP